MEELQISTNKRVWTQHSDSYLLGDASSQLDKLPVGIYRLEADPMGNLFLKNTARNFTFDYKVYGTEQRFIDRVQKTWKSRTGNMGVLLNGTKGTGKSVTSKLLANQIGLPVIVVPFASKELATFLNDIHQDVAVFIDEYEKLYNNYDNSILSVMDGVLSGDYRRLFILTTNDLFINENMLQRPSRIYYLKTFDNIDPAVLNNILDDLLINQEFRDDILKFISEMGIITIDLAKSIIEEVNLHDESPYEFKDIFNVRNQRNDLYDLYDVTDPKNPEIIVKQVRLEFPFSEVNIGRSLYTDHKTIGTMLKVFDRNTALFEKQDCQDDEDESDEDIDSDIKASGKKRVTKKLVVQKEASVVFNSMSQYIY